MEEVPLLRERIDQAAQLVQEFGLDEVEWSGKGWKVKMASEAPSWPSLPAEASSGLGLPLGAEAPRKARKAKSEAKAPPAPQGQPISTPMMGIFYAAPSPGAKPFVSVGAQVQAGDVVGLIEAMKVLNEITSPFAGTVLSIQVENGQLVQPGEVLVRVG